MARDIGQRLSRLRIRRAGVDRLDRISESFREGVVAKSYSTEPWQKRAQPSYTRYALGAMEEVDGDYTRISLETAERVGNQLRTGLGAEGRGVAFRLQGSVPLNVHIRGVSDVDLLTLDTAFLTYSASGSKSQRGQYYPSEKNSLDVLKSLRQSAERTLRNAYPAAKVDTSGGKAIKISGGSLARPVDVVPSHWHDTDEYQASSAEHDRAVTILDKRADVAVRNLPFLHIKRVGDRDGVVGGSLRKAIRLCKNVKADAENEGATIALPSFDIAATMYHANQAALTSGAIFELAILAETQRHLDALYVNQAWAKTLYVPDGSRLIFDTPQKIEALGRLSVEMDDLLREVAKEQNPSLVPIAKPDFESCRVVVASRFV